MGAEDELAPFRNSPFQEPLTIASMLGEPGEENTRTTMDTDLELTMVVTVRTLGASLD